MFRNLLILAILAGSAAVSLADATTRPSVCVSAFKTYSPPVSQWVGDAIRDELSAGLANSFTITADHPDFTIEGSVQVVADQIRVTGRILSASGQQVAALHYDGALRDLFSVEDVLVNRAERIMSPARQAAPQAVATILPGSAETTLPQSRYFDGNLSAMVSPPDRWADQRTHAMLYSQSSYWCYYGCWNNCVFSPCRGWGIQYTAAPITGW